MTGNVTGTGGLISANLGSITYSTGTLSTGSGALYVGNSGPAILTVDDSATVTVGGNLYVNYQATRTGDTSSLIFKSGTLTVTGQTIIGNGAMPGGTGDYNAKFLQTDGTANFNGLLTVGGYGTATSLFDINGGSANANAGLVVGSSGNGQLSIYGSARSA